MSIAATQLSTTAFTTAADLTGEFVPGVRVRADCGADGLFLGSVTTASHDSGTGLTTVTLAPDAGGLTANLSGVTHGNDSPDSLPRATTGLFGAVRLATPAEAAAGTDTAKVMTAAGASQAGLSRSRDSLGKFPGLVPQPSLNLFCGEAASDSAPAGTFTRSTTSTRLGQGGLVETVAAGGLRREWDVTGKALGWLIEPARTNLVTCSEQCDNTVWTKFLVSITADATTAPDGTLSADKIVETTDSGDHSVRYLVGAATAGDLYVASVYLKAGERSQALLRMGRSASEAATFNLATQTVSGLGANVRQTGLGSLGNGWFRCSIAVTIGTTSSAQYLQVTLAGDGGTSYAGDGASGLHVWGAQAGPGPVSTSYIPTSTSSVARAADVWTIPLATTWCNPLAGTMFASARAATGAPAAGTLQVLTQYDDGSAGNRIRVVRDASRVLRCLVTGAGTELANLDLGIVEDGAALRTACAWSASGIVVSRDGGTATTAAVSPPTGLTTLRIGSDTAGSSQWHGHVLHNAHFPVALSVTQLQAITL